MKITSNNPILTTIAVFVGFNFFLTAFRFLVTSGIGYGFLVWNLVLAIVPLLISLYLTKKNPTRKKVLYLSIVWLLFLPNAPYILTDFLHFRHLSHSMPAWFDLLLLASYSITGLLFGLLSMRQMHLVWMRTFGKIANWLIPVAAILSGFGIYLGRFERYNSWDVLSDPMGIICDSMFLLTELRVIGFTLGYGTLLLLTYYFFRFQSKLKL